MSNDIKKTRLVAAVWCFKSCSEYLILIVSSVILPKPQLPTASLKETAINADYSQCKKFLMISVILLAEAVYSTVA